MKPFFFFTLGLIISIRLVGQDVTGPEHQLNHFFEWYIEGIKKQERGGPCFSNPLVEKGSDGKVCMKINEYLERLQQSGFFSDFFMKMEKQRIELCREKLATIDYSIYDQSEDHDFEPECSFLYYNYWLGGHELPQGIIVKYSQISSDSASFDFVFYEDLDNKKNEWGGLNKAFMWFDGGNWEIDKLYIK